MTDLRCHPGLDPGSRRSCIPLPSGLQIIPEITPVGVHLFDEVYLPLAAPALEFLFLRYGGVHVLIGFKPDEAAELILLYEAVLRLFAVQPDAADQVAGDACLLYTSPSPRD